MSEHTVTDLSPEELDAFRGWSSPILAGIRQANATGRANIPVPTPEDMLQEWNNIGRPGFTEPLKPWEVRAGLGEGPFYVDEFPEVPFELAEGLEWIQQVVTDPTRLEWVSQPVEEEGEGTVVIPGQLKIMSDGTYVSLLSMLPVDTATAELMIADFQRSIEAPTDDDVGLTDFEKAQIDRWGADRGLQEEELTVLKDWQASQTREAAAGRRGAEELRREEILAGLTGPRDWIKYWEQQQNVIPQARRRNLLEAANDALQLAQAQAVGSDERLKLEMKAESLFGRAEKFLEWTPIPGGGRAGRFPETTTPPTPEWLPQHLIGGAPGVGEPIERLAVRTPSPQQFGRMAPTAQQGLAGFADWAAEGRGKSRTWLDVLGQMEQMLPQGVPGGGFSRWQPATQRA